MLTIFFVIVLIFSVIVHEISHGYVALKLGDTTARDAGRLTLNPLKHIDMVGSVILPLIMATIGGPVFGWARPVPYDPRFLKNPKKSAGLIALAGPASNLLLAIMFAGISRLILEYTDGLAADSSLTILYLLITVIVQVNISLALFNLLPIPPLDGSGILFSLLPRGAERFQAILEQYGFIILIALVFMGLDFLNPVFDILYRFLLGGASPLV